MPINIKIPIKIGIKVTHADVKKYLSEQERLKPACFIVSDTIVETKAYGREKGYAEFLEFGTGPSHVPDPHARYWIGPKGREALIEWAKRKLGMKEKEAKPFVDRLILRIYQYGMAPHPFFRPAVYPIFDQAQTFFNMGYSLYDMCWEMMNRAEENVRSAGWQGEDMNDTGNMVLSFRVQYLEQAQADAILTDRSIQLYADRAWEQGTRK